jgi:hypothetical protein
MPLALCFAEEAAVSRSLDKLGMTRGRAPGVIDGFV